MPFRYALWQLSNRLGIPPWCLEGYPLHRPTVEWLIRCFEFARMEAAAVPKKTGRG